jgi:hypothetical protein
MTSIKSGLFLGDVAKLDVDLLREILGFLDP